MTRRAAPGTGQFALFDPAEMEREAAQQAAAGRLPATWASLPDGPAHGDMPTGKCLYNSPACGFANRVAEFALWTDAYGNFGCYGRSHAWRPGSVGFSMHRENLAGYLMDRCEPTVLDCDLRRDRRRDGTWDPVPPCGHDGQAETETRMLRGLWYRGACRKIECDWEGPVRSGESAAVEDGMDHAWPGWRDLPPVPPLPAGAKVFDAARTPRQAAAHKTFANWVTKINAVYPPGWLESGGPIRTLRRPMETRHVESATPWGGYDLAVITPGDEDDDDAR